jgi:hypothetical protein
MGWGACAGVSLGVLIALTSAMVLRPAHIVAAVAVALLGTALGGLVGSSTAVADENSRRTDDEEAARPTFSPAPVYGAGVAAILILSFLPLASGFYGLGIPGTLVLIGAVSLGVLFAAGLMVREGMRRGSQVVAQLAIVGALCVISAAVPGGWVLASGFVRCVPLFT